MVNANRISKVDAKEVSQGGVDFGVDPAFQSRVVWVINGKGWFMGKVFSVSNGEE